MMKDTRFAARTRRLVFSAAALVAVCGATPAWSQVTANSLAELRSLGLSSNNQTVVLSATGGDPHPVTGVVTPGQYWINGDHIANPTNSMPIFMDLRGTGNTYDLSGATINLDTRKLDGFGRNLGHDSGVDIIQINGSNNTVRGITLIAHDLALDTDPNAQRYADWATQFVELSGDNNTVDGAHIVTSGSRTDTYGLGDAFGKGASQGIQPFIGHRKASAFRVGEATNAVANDIHLEVNSFGHGFFVQNSTDTTLTNSTITGELFSTQGVIDRPEYQEHGHTYWGNPIPEDHFISGAEGGVRMYTGSSGLTVDGVVVTGMRTGFATTLGGGTITLNDVEAYGTESAFGIKSNTTITNALGDAINGPLLVMDKDNSSNVSVDIELVGGAPINHDYAIAYVSGNNVDINISSDLAAEYFEGSHLFRASQFFYDNWREADAFDSFDFPGYDHVNSVITNDANMLLVLGEQAQGNVGRSQGGVISNGKENHYDGVTLVQTGSRLIVTHEKGLGNSGEETGAEFDNNGNVVYAGTATAQTLDDNATVVMDGATLELAAGIRIVDEKLILTGDGVDGQGALFSSDDDNRFGDSKNSNQSVIVLNGSASIGVQGAGDQLIVGQVQGIGDLTKRGLGKLSLEKANTFSGNLIVEAGVVSLRSGGVNNGLSVAAGASVTSLGSNAYDTLDTALIDGEMDLNGRSGDDSLSHQIGQLLGSGSIISSNPTSGTSATLNLTGNSTDGVFDGTINGLIHIEKTGSNTQTFNGNLTHTGTTTINAGKLFINGNHTGGAGYSVLGGALGGAGTIDAFVTVHDGGRLETGPGSTALGSLHLAGGVALQDGSTLALELANPSSFEQLTVTGSAQLAGKLELDALNPSALDFGDAFTLVSTSNGISGGFSQVDGVGLGSMRGLQAGLAVTYDADNVLAQVALLGDTNLDGAVNGLDASALFASFGDTGQWASGDFNGDGLVNGLDASSMLANFGVTLGSSVTQAMDAELVAQVRILAVPEPSSAAVIGAMSLLLCSRRRR